MITVKVTFMKLYLLGTEHTFHLLRLIQLQLLLRQAYLSVDWHLPVMILLAATSDYKNDNNTKYMYTRFRNKFQNVTNFLAFYLTANVLFGGWGGRGGIQHFPTPLSFSINVHAKTKELYCYVFYLGFCSPIWYRLYFNKLSPKVLNLLVELYVHLLILTRQHLYSYQ